MKSVIGLHGKSSVGKTTVAKELGAMLGVPVRHCGEAIKALAQSRGVHLEELSAADHAAVDAETYRLAQERTGFLVIEGRFLPYVLSGLDDILMFELTCSQAERNRRHGSPGMASLEAHDALSARLRSTLYDKALLASSCVSIGIGTDGLTPIEVAGEIMSSIKKAENDKT